MIKKTHQMRTEKEQTNTEKEVIESVTVEMPKSVNFLVTKKLSDELDNIMNYINEEIKKIENVRELLLKNENDNLKLIANNHMLMINYSILIIENKKICTDIDELTERLNMEKTIENKNEFADEEYATVFFLSLQKTLGKKLIKKIKELKINHNNITKILSK